MKLLRFVPYIHQLTQPSPLICYTKNTTFLSTLKPRPSAEDPRGVFELPPLSPHRPGVCSFKPNAEMQQQNQPSSQTLHRQRKDSSTPQVLSGEQPAGNQHPMPKKPESTSSITHPNYQGLIAGSRTSARKRLGCWPQWNFQGLHCSPTTPLSHISQTTNFPSAVPCTIHYTHKAPAFLTHLWEHLGTEDRITLSEQLMANCSCRPCAE